MTGDCRYPAVAMEGKAMFMAWIVVEGKKANIYFRRSMDEGTTWNSRQKISNETGECLPPSIAVNTGVVHVAWIDYGETIDGELYYAQSPDGGDTWEKNLILVKDANSARYPFIICQKSNVYLIWQDVENTIYFKASYNRGKTWENAKLLGRVGTHSCFCFPPAFSVNGKELVVAWSDFRQDKKGFNVRVYGLQVYKPNKKMVSSIISRTSSDNGHTWSKERVLARCTISREMKDEIDNPIMVSDGSLSNIFWLDRRNVEIGELYYARFNPMEYKGVLPGKNICPSPKRSPKRPSVTVDRQGNLHFTWATFFTGKSIIHYGAIDQAGNILREKRDMTLDVGRYHNPVITSTPSGLLYLFWFNEPPIAKDEWSKIFLKISGDNGLTWEDWDPLKKDR
jgi:Neuraminidase (sialidase)